MFPLSQHLKPSNVAVWFLRIKSFLHQVAWPFQQVVFWGHVPNLKHFISIYRGLMGFKLDKVVTYRERLFPFKSHDPLVMWPLRVQMKNKTNDTSTFTRLIATKLGRMVTSMRRFNKSRTLWLLGLPKSGGKLNTFYLYYHKLYDHQTWKCGYTHSGTSTQ